jgi:PAS domain S-box-containing protein
MFETPENPPDTALIQDLRARAEFLQKIGGAPASRGHALGAEALAALYRLSCSGDNVNEGLRLLHELQTHQIEIDLLQEQKEANEREVEAELARYRMLYEFAPIAYLVLSANGHIIECNRAAAALLDMARNDMEGAPLEDLLAPASRFVLSWYLKKLLNGSPGERCTVQARNGSPTSSLLLFANLAPSGEVLVFITRQDRSTKPGEA